MGYCRREALVSVLNEYNRRVAPPLYLYFYLKLHSLYYHSLGDMYHTLMNFHTYVLQNHFSFYRLYIRSAPAIIVMYCIAYFKASCT